MKNFTTVHDVADINTLIEKALRFKKNQYSLSTLGRNKTLGLIFMNPSLSTRLSTQRAAQNLGMQIITMNIEKNGWALETSEGTVMNGRSIDNVRDAASIIGEYCDIVGIRCFPGLTNKKEDYTERVLVNFMKYCRKPLISLESATLHPIQSLADLITIRETCKVDKPKVVLSWTPNKKALPQAISNSFCEWMNQSDVELVITHPEGYELSESFVRNTRVIYNQEEALKQADYIYVNNWSSFKDYGKVLCKDESWLLTPDKLALTNNAKVMYSFPFRRSMDLIDDIIDGPSSLVLQQAGNKIYAAQAVIAEILEKNFN